MFEIPPSFFMKNIKHRYLEKKKKKKKKQNRTEHVFNEVYKIKPHTVIQISVKGGLWG